MRDKNRSKTPFALSLSKGISVGSWFDKLTTNGSKNLGDPASVSASQGAPFADFFVSKAQSRTHTDPVLKKCDLRWHQVTDQREGNTFLWEFIPVNQEIERYKDILTAQAFPNNRKQSISSFVQALFASVQNACLQVKVNGPKKDTEFGYEIAYAQIYCSQQNGRDFGVHMFFKFIKGSDALYVVQREFRVPATEVAGVASFAKGQEKAAADMLKAVNTANDYLAHSVYLCAKNANDDRCAKH